MSKSFILLVIVDFLSLLCDSINKLFSSSFKIVKEMVSAKKEFENFDIVLLTLPLILKSSVDPKIKENVEVQRTKTVYAAGRWADEQKLC